MGQNNYYYWVKPGFPLFSTAAESLNQPAGDIAVEPAISWEVQLIWWLVTGKLT